MSNEEITKALGLCFNINDNAGLNCGECPYKERTECSLNLYSDTINLINRQQAEIERLKNNIQYFYSEEHMEQMEFEKKSIEYNAISKFAEKLIAMLAKYDMYGTLCIAEDIDNLVKEMVGEE